MKGITTVKAIAHSLVFVLVIAFQAHAGWELYDNFDSGATIDQRKWSIDDSCGTISIENGEVKFVHLSGHPDDSNWLTMIDRPQSIAGIRVTVRVENCTGDVFGRIGGIIGRVNEGEVGSTLRIKPFTGSIEAAEMLLDADNLYLSDIFFGSFKYSDEEPFDITNHNFTVEWSASTRTVVAKTETFGDITFELDEPLSPTTDHFRAIGTRSPAGEGPCEVYFDDVYVYRKPSLTAPHLLLLED